MQQCKCEHWQECPVCEPRRFDKDGKKLPPEPTPLQDARAKLEAMESHAKRLALSLECLLLECKDIAAVSKWWDSSQAALTEYQAAIDRLYPQEHVSPLGTGEQQAEPVVSVTWSEVLRQQAAFCDGHCTWLDHASDCPIGNPLY